MSLALIVVLAALLWTLLGRIGVRLASGGEDAISPIPLLAAGLLGGGIGLMNGSDEPVIAALSVVLCSGLLAGGVVDRQSGWAPDLVIFPIVVIALVMGAVTGAWNMTPWLALVYACLGYWIFQGIWLAAAWKFPDFSLPPPGDLAALLIPMLFFGPDMRFAATMAVITVLLILARQFPPVLRLFSRPDLIMRIAKEGTASYPEGGHGITFLALAFPATVLSLIIFSTV